MIWNTEEEKKAHLFKKQVSYTFLDMGKKKHSYLNLQMKKKDSPSSVSPNEHLQWHITKKYGIIVFLKFH